MNKRFNRGAGIAASLVVAAGTLGTAAPVFANPTTGEAQGTITATNIKEKDVKVTAYQIVDGVYADGKLVNFALVDGTNMPIANIESPTSTEITKIANYIQNANIQGVELTKDAESSYSATVDAGEYIVLVTGSNATVYNPAVVSVNISDANDLSKVTPGSVDMASRFVAGDTAYMKSSLSSMDKGIVDSSKNAKGDTVAVGDTVKFLIDGMTFPSYSDDYKAGSVFYRISDKLDADSFDPIEDIVVMVADKAVEAGDDTYTVTEDADKKGFVISFAESYIRANEGKPIKVTYQSKLAATADLNFAENKNVAKINYANDPAKDAGYDKDTNPGHEEQKVTYHYTFGIDADIDAQSVGENTVNEETHEFNKVTKASGESFYVETTSKTSTTTKTMASPHALAGAEFTLYSDEALASVVKTATSDENGHVSFTGLDEGTYYIKETAAPASYTLNNTVYKAVIEAELGENGVLSGYTITFFVKDADGNWQNAGSAAYTATSTVDAATGEVTNTVINKVVTPAEVVDTKLAGLPSTGSNTAIVFAVVGLVGGMMALVIKKKNHNA